MKMYYKMIYGLHDFVFISYWLLCSDAVPFQGFYGVKTEDYPKDSCLKIFNTENKGKCIMNCLNALDVNYMFSYNGNQKACLCCKDLSGNDVTNSEWETFVPRLCKSGYVAYNYPDFQICLKFVPVPASYPDAVAHCRAEDGDLIRIDSTLKYNIFKEHLAPFLVAPYIEVWIQAVKVGQQWMFHDGSPIPNACPISMSNFSSEVHLRAVSSTFQCFDYVRTGPFLYVCEYYRQFPNMRIHGKPNIYDPTNR